MSRADEILARFKECAEEQTVTQLVESVQDLSERDTLTYKLVAGQLPREAEFWNLSLGELKKITGLRPPRTGVKVHDLIMWLTRSANLWRKSVFYQDILDKDPKLQAKKNALTWVTKKR